ncbi:hypothetical protein RHAL1_00640 [Beijerinckiaceae bacterium RH AL1]|jgi:hypothetical protein|nr:hypothetical protein RHAL8_00609 [Beijerinckiaceae bacterium RH AL8]VVB43287.1 hypothetical protein RHCH11_RHCH11_00611 [Beijerinckiaceae bacterium RH CH11]VVC53757.1 hypothetical protein RHAL1_00640 [Beijerinckiaceae bacterium RH AL1]
MRSTIMTLTAATVLSFAALGADAMPAGVSAGASVPAPQLTYVAEGCGPGFARGPAGGCRRIGAVVVRPAVVVRRPAVIVRRPGCGVRVGPIGVRTPC